MTYIKNLDRASKTFTKALSLLLAGSKNLATKDLVAPIKPWLAMHRNFARKHARTIRSHNTTVGRRLVKQYKTFGARPRSKRYVPCLISRQKWMASSQELRDDVCDKNSARFPRKLQRRINAFIAKTKAAHVDKPLARRIAKVTDKAQACVTALLPPKKLPSPRMTP